MRSGLQRHYEKAGLTGLFLFFALVIALPLAIADRAIAAALMIEVVAAEAAYDSRSNTPLISFKMSDASRAAFAELTRNNVGRKLQMRVDGQAMLTPVIREPITGGTGQLSGSFTAEQARVIADRLRRGTAKLEVEIVD